jgi:hypothetical protein
MNGWDGITSEQIRDELAGYTGDDGMSADDGWLTVMEVAERLRMNRHDVALWVKLKLAAGAVEQGERQARGIDGRRIRQRVYRMVEL